MQTCAACTAAYAQHAQLRRALAQTSVVSTRAGSLARTLERPDVGDIIRRASRRRTRYQSAATGRTGARDGGRFRGCMLIVTSMFVYTLQQLGAEVGPVVVETISSHIRSLQAQHLMDVVSSDQHTVKPWFDGKLDFSPRVQDLASAGFPLIDGRLDALGNRSVAALVYRRHPHVINLHQWTAGPAAATPDTVGRHGYHVIQWSADDTRFVAVSDVNRDELKQFVRAFRNATDTPTAR
jgi:anti-sigma factor RsiW